MADPDLRFQARVAYLTAMAVEAFVRPSGLEDDVVKSVRSRRGRGTEARCAEVEGKDGKQPGEFCFDSSGALVNESYGNQHFEYADFRKFGGKVFPKSIRVYESDSRVLDISADDLSAPSDPRPELFQHAAGARQLAWCDRWPADAIKKVPPQYPQAARGLRQQGTVILYALRSGDGAWLRRQPYWNPLAIVWIDQRWTRSSNGCIHRSRAMRFLWRRKSRFECNRL